MSKYIKNTVKRLNYRIVYRIREALGFERVSNMRRGFTVIDSQRHSNIFLVCVALVSIEVWTLGEEIRTEIVRCTAIWHSTNQ